MQNMSNYFHYSEQQTTTIAQLIADNFSIQKLFSKEGPLSRQTEGVSQDQAIIRELIKGTVDARSSVVEKTAVDDKAKDLLLFLDKHVLFEFVNLYLNWEYYFEQNFIEFAEIMTNNFQRKDIIWSLFKTAPHSSPVVAFDRESTVTIKCLS